MCFDFYRWASCRLCACLLGAAFAAIAIPSYGNNGDAGDDGVPTAPLIPSVAVSASKIDQRRDDTAAMLVIGHDELMRQGDSTLADVLKRLPGISIVGAPGQGGEIRMHGLGSGYTQVMLDGVPAPAGFSLDALAPDLIERIEIMRVATAQLSNQAIAGAINIVLKKKVLASQREFSAALADSGAQLSPTMTTQLSDRAGAWSWTLAGTLTQKRTLTPSLEREVQSGPDGVPVPALVPTLVPVLLRLTQQQENSRNDLLSLAPRLSWTIGDGDTLVSQSFVSISRLNNTHPAREADLLGGASEFPLSVSTFAASTRVLRSDLDWTHALEAGASLELKLGLSESRRSAAFHFFGEAQDGAFLGEHQVGSGPVDKMLQLTGTYRRPFGEHQVLTAGWDGSDRQRDEYRRETDFSADGVAAATMDDSYAATIHSLALFAQDEWTISPRWSLNLGVRWESVQTRSGGAASTALAPVSSRAGVWSPLLQTLYKLGGKDQLRLALSHTYKAPAIAQLIPRRYAIDNNNSATNPDTEGNPQLRPELAWGVDAAYEHYLGGGLFSASVFLRRIRDVTINQLTDTGGIWTSTPVNDGVATLRGIELEAKFALPTLMRNAPPLDVRANLTRNWSAIAAIAGPDNRIDGQTALTANLGLDYHRAGSRLTLGGNLTFADAGPVRLSQQWSTAASAKRQLDVYALWKMDGKTRLRLSALNLLRQDYSTQQRYADTDGVETRTLLTPTWATLRLLWERAF